MDTQNILLDMDGVVADFLNPAAAAVGLNLDLVPRGKWDVFAEAGYDLGEVWGKIDNYEFWRSLPIVPKAQTFVALLQEHFMSVTFLTSCSMSADCSKAKMEWLRQYFGPKVKAILCNGYASKALCAKPANVLIDDCDRNVDAFRAAGGQAILVPRPWNTDYLGGTQRMAGTSYDTVDYNVILNRLGLDCRIHDSESESETEAV
jgi:5'(3')-deoxyribonucleotidase